MATVIPLRPEFALPPEVHARPIKWKGIWYQWMGLGPGRKPGGHPSLVHGPRGGVKIKRGQVWVAFPKHELWVVARIQLGAPHQSFPHRITLVRYKGDEEWKLAEATMRGSLRVWEKAEEERVEMCRVLPLTARFNPESPWRGKSSAEAGARAFFGFDEYGNRTEIVQERSPKPKGGPPTKGSVWKYRNGASKLTVTGRSTHGGEGLWLHVVFPKGGFGAIKYDAHRWYAHYVRTS